MIALMRKMIHNNFYRVILWVFLFMMAVSSGIALVNVGGNKDWVIKVYKQIMDHNRFQIILRSIKYQHDMFRQQGIHIGVQNVQKEAVEAAVTSLLTEHVMSKMKLAVPQSFIDLEVKRQLQHLPSYFFKENGVLNQEAFAQLIAPLSIDDFVNQIVLDSKNRTFFDIVNAATYVPEFEVVLQYNSEFANKTYSYLTLPFQKYLAQVKTKQPSSEVLQKFYKKSKNADKFKTIERRSGTVWVFDSNNYAITISDHEAKQWYDKHKSSRYLLEPAMMQVRSLLIKMEPGKEAEAKAKIAEIKQEADKDPSKFESLVRKLSDDTTQASRGGLSEFFTKENPKINKLVAETAFEYLTTDGQISEPIKTERGYEIVQRVQRSLAKYKEFKAVVSEIKADLRTERFKKRFAQDAARVLSGAKYNPEALENFIIRFKGVKKELAMDARKPGILYTHLFKLEDGRYAHFFDKEDGIILHCDQVERSVLPPLEKIQDRVLSVYYEEQAIDLLRSDLDHAAQDAKKMTLDEVAQKYGIASQKASFTFKNGKAEQNGILKEPEIQAKIKNLQSEGAVLKVETKQDGVLLRLDKIAPMDQELFKEQKAHLTRVLFYTKMYQNKASFIASLYRTAKINNKIEIKNEILNSTKEV